MSYRILGAGPSGLAAAITLAKAGHAVDVYERRGDCGARFGGDLQGIENWSTSLDALEELRAAGIAVDFHCAPISHAIQTNGVRDSSLSFARPGLYLVKRGAAHDTLDQSLKRQALAAGARLHFRESIDPERADIVATGPRGRKIFAIDRGVVFDTDAPDCAVVLMDDRAAPKGYAYLLVSGGYGCLATMLFEDFPSIHERLAYTRRLLESRYGVTVRNPRPVGGVGHFTLRAEFKKGSALHVGEAAGLQDFLWGFGIRSAIRSGVGAAGCVLEGRDWQAHADAQFSSALRASVVNRFLFENLRHGRYAVLMTLFKLGGPHALLRAISRLNPLHRVLFPAARAYTRRRYPQIEI
ncbi:MAG: Thiazole biosynthetic enzyme [Gemmatimonadetes bacterium]|nr:Thiazole biosynthetic enzyme [Gemmatimonadota bacterium]